ncbi:hypothetical protein [Neobacillus sp. 204]|uniref:hypothetical protein n=1 Tax=Neobacillus sp. 204 TaxID=3383351 RepID=UPI00397C1D0B
MVGNSSLAVLSTHEQEIQKMEHFELYESIVITRILINLNMIEFLLLETVRSPVSVKHCGKGNNGIN